MKSPQSNEGRCTRQHSAASEEATVVCPPLPIFFLITYMLLNRSKRVLVASGIAIALPLLKVSPAPASVPLELPHQCCSDQPKCKAHANEPQVVGSGWIDGSGRGGIGIVYQGLALAHENRTPIIGSEIGSLD